MTDAFKALETRRGIGLADSIAALVVENVDASNIESKRVGRLHGKVGHFRWRLYHTPTTIGGVLSSKAAAAVAETSVLRPIAESLEGYDGPDDGVSQWIYSDYRTASGFYFSRLLLARAFGL